MQEIPTVERRPCTCLLYTSMDILVSQMMEKQGITEELKARDQMEWVRAVNNVRNAAEEIVLKELIYR